MSGPLELPLSLNGRAFPLPVDTVRESYRDRFDVCVRAHGPALFRLASRLARGAADAEDLLQEAFLRAWRAIDRFRGDAELSTWLFRIVLNAGRSRRRRVEPPLPEEVGASGDTAERAGNRDLLGRVLAAVDALPRRQREALLLRATAGLGYREIAGIMRIKETAVKSHLAQARRRLGERFPGEVAP